MRGELAFLELQNVELEVSLVVTKKANGKVNVYVAELGSDISREQVQRVRLAFNVTNLLPDADLQTKASKVDNTMKKSVRRVKRGGRSFR